MKSSLERQNPLKLTQINSATKITLIDKQTLLVNVSFGKKAVGGGGDDCIETIALVGRPSMLRTQSKIYQSCYELWRVSHGDIRKHSAGIVISFPFASSQSDQRFSSSDEKIFLHWERKGTIASNI